MKKLYLFILCAFALSFGQNCWCTCCTTEKKIYKPHSSSVPMVYKEQYSLSMKSEPLVFVDKPVVKKVTTRRGKVVADEEPKRVSKTTTRKAKEFKLYEEDEEPKEDTIRLNLKAIQKTIEKKVN